MADPTAVSTADHLTAQLRILLGQSRISPEQLSQKSGVSVNTVRGMAKEGSRFPQQSTLEAVVEACGEDPKPWVDAWHRANDTRPRGERAGGTKSLQVQVDELTETVRELAEQVAKLTVERGLETEARADRVHREQAYHRFLVSLPEAGFTRTVWINPALSPTLSPDEPSYPSKAVYAALSAVTTMAARQAELPQLAAFLSAMETFPLVQPRSVSDTEERAVHKVDVDFYFAGLRRCVSTYFEDLSGIHSPQRGEWIAGPPQ